MDTHKQDLPGKVGLWKTESEICGGCFLKIQREGGRVGASAHLIQGSGVVPRFWSLWCELTQLQRHAVQEREERQGGESGQRELKQLSQGQPLPGHRSP